MSFWKTVPYIPHLNIGEKKPGAPCFEDMKKETYGLTEDELKDLAEYMGRYSEPSTGLRLRSAQLGELLRDMGFSLTEAEESQLVGKADPNGDGWIGFRKLLPLVGPLFERSRLKEENADAVFALLDATGSGLVRGADLAGLTALLGQPLPADYLARAVEEADMDGDRALSSDELKYFIAGEIF